MFAMKVEGTRLVALGMVSDGSELAPGWEAITAERYAELMALRGGGTLIDGVYTPPAPRAPVVTQAQFVTLLGASIAAKIRRYRLANPDDNAVEYLFELTNRAGDAIDLGHPIVTGGLALLATRLIDGEPVITTDDAARILSGALAPDSGFSAFV